MLVLVLLLLVVLVLLLLLLIAGLHSKSVSLLLYRFVWLFTVHDMQLLYISPTVNNRTGGKSRLAPRHLALAGKQCHFSYLSSVLPLIVYLSGCCCHSGPQAWSHQNFF